MISSRRSAQSVGNDLSLRPLANSDIRKGEPESWLVDGKTRRGSR